eukprot:1045679-Rhodomonas_salina.1
MRWQDESEALLQSLRFGQISFEATEEILQWVKAVGGLKDGEGSILCDMLSSDGRILVAASLIHRFDLAMGMEESDDNYDEISRRIAKLQEQMKAKNIKLAAKELALEFQSSKDA